jgi:hypothetical protein
MGSYPGLLSGVTEDDSLQIVLVVEERMRASLDAVDISNT